MAAHHRALDRARQARVDPVAGEPQTVECRCRSPAGRADRRRARTSRASRGRPCRGRASRRGRRGSPRRPRARRARRRRPCARSPARRRRSPRATDARSRGRTPAACRRPTASSGPADPTNGSSITRRSYQRFTVTIGFEPIAPASATSRASGGGTGGAKSVRMPNQGTAATTRGVAMRSPRTSTPVTRVPSVTTRASAPVRTSPPRLSMNARAGSAYIWCSGRSGSAIADAAAIGAEHLGEHAHERRRERFVGRLVERRERQRLPQPGRQLLRLPARLQPVRHRHRVVFGHTFRSGRAPAAPPAATAPSAGPTGDRATTSRPTSAPRRAGAAAAAAPDIAAPTGCRRDPGTARAAPADGARCPSAPMRRRNANVCV